MVIGILAAIAIIAFNGVQSKARASAVQQSATMANKKVMVYAVTNSEQYPVDLATVGIINSDTTYQYSVNNSSSPATFCITATNLNLSYYISNIVSRPTIGACAGHGVGGVAAVTNLVNNPSVEIDSSGWGVANGATCVRQSTSALVGAFGMSCSTASSVDSGAVIPSANISALSGTTYTAVFTLRTNSATAYNYSISVQGPGGTNARTTRLVSAAQTSTFTLTWTAASSGTVSFYALRTGGQGTGSASFDVDGALLAVGTIANFADGNSPNWVWNGVPNLSTSTGPPL